jgi:hypothetical protein
MKIIAIREIFKLQSSFYLPKHSDFVMMNWNEINDSLDNDAYIQTNIQGARKAFHLNPMYSWVRNSKKPYLVMEQAVFRKGVDIKDPQKAYYRLGLNSYTYDKGIFNNEGSPPDRWNLIKEKCQIEIKPWKSTGDYILILLQNPEDTSLNNLKGDYNKWIENVVKEISVHTDEDIVIRLHPCFIQKFNISFLNNIKVPNKITISGTVKGNDVNPSHGGKDFEEDLKGARAVIAFSSNGLQEAVCEGIPAISMDKSSFAWPVSYHSLEVLSERNIKCEFERDQWLYDCAYCQWTPDELDSGYPHKKLLRVN